MGTLEIISALLKEQGKTQKELCEYLGIKKNAYTNWKSGVNKSYVKYLPQIASFFDVSIDYLLGKTELKKGAVPTEQPLTPLQEKALNMILSLPDSALEDLMRFLDSFQGKQ